MPFTPNTGTQASSTNPKTWGTFVVAVCFCEMQPNLSGIGFVFSAEDPFTGIDLDKCRDSETGEIQSWALDIVRRFNSYAEISPSGTGIHIIVKCRPPSGKRKGRIELYDRGRYFHNDGGPFAMQIIESQSELNRLYQEIGGRMGEPAATRIPVGSKSMLSDAEVLEKALSAKNGFLFADLYEGRWQERYPSQSEAESALCFILAFWTGRNAEQIDRIFRDSALFREKWDERHGAGTYGDLTIRKAIEIQTTVYDPEYKNARALLIMGNSIRFARMFKETLRW